MFLKRKDRQSRLMINFRWGEKDGQSAQKDGQLVQNLKWKERILSKLKQLEKFQIRKIGKVDWDNIQYNNTIIFQENNLNKAQQKWDNNLNKVQQKWDNHLNKIQIQKLDNKNSKIIKDKHKEEDQRMVTIWIHRKC